MRSKWELDFFLFLGDLIVLPLWGRILYLQFT